MAIGGIIGSIRVALGLDTAQFQNGAKEMQGTLGGISKTLKSFAVGIGAALSFGAVVRAMQSAIDKADELGKTAQKIGLPVEALSKLEYAARLADVELGGLSVGVGKLSQALAATAGGTSNDATKALAAIGVAAVDSTGKLRPTEDVIYDVAEAFSQMKDGAGKTALAIAIFGRSGKDLIPLLNAGKAGLKESADEAQRLGQVIDTKTAKAAEQFNDNLTRLKAAMEGLTNKTMVALIGKFVEFTDAMVELSKSTVISDFFDELSKRIDTTVREFNTLVGTVQTVKDIFNRVTDENPWPDVEANIADVGNELDRMTVKSKENIDLLNSLNLGKPQIKSKPLVDAPIVQAPNTEAINAQKKAMREALQVFEQTTNAVDKYKADLAQLDFLLKGGTITQQEYNEHVKQLKENFAETTPVVNELAQSISDTFQNSLSGVFDELIDGSFNLLDSLKDIASQITKIFANNALQQLFNPATNPSQGGGIGGFFKNLLGFAKGGTIFPGSGGQDSQVVAFRKSPNERVDITKPGQQLSSGHGDINVNVQNYTPASVSVSNDSGGNPIVIIRDALKGMVSDGSLDSGFKNRFGDRPIRNNRT